MSLTTPRSVWNLQQSLQAKAKANPTLRFYSLYDKIYRRDVLAHAWQRCRANGGSAGVDGQTFEQIEAQGLGTWLDELTEQLKNKTYQPQAVRRVYIPKADGKQRPLGIPSLRDRVVQMALVIVLGPILEADLLGEQYAYREHRSAHDAICAVYGGLSRRVSLRETRPAPAGKTNRKPAVGENLSTLSGSRCGKTARPV